MGTQLVDGETSTNEDHKVWRPLWFHQRPCTTFYFRKLWKKYKR